MYGMIGISSQFVGVIDNPCQLFKNVFVKANK